jgi:hypothetical protein
MVHHTVETVVVVALVVEEPTAVQAVMVDQATTVVLAVSLDLIQRPVDQRATVRALHQVEQEYRNINQGLP